MMYCQDQNALRIILSEGLFQAISMFTKDTPEQNVRIMVEDVLRDYRYEPVTVILRAIEEIRTGQVKVYGLVTPFDLREAINRQVELLAIERERVHENNKGYGNQEIGVRTSGRISDFFGVEKEVPAKKKPGDSK
jgi:hypothetical protein